MIVDDVMIDAFENELLKIAAYQEILEKEAISLPFGQTARLAKALKAGAGKVNPALLKNAPRAASGATKAVGGASSKLRSLGMPSPSLAGRIG